MAVNPDSNAARRKANTEAIGKASKKIQAIADVKKTAGEVGADKRITARTIKEMRQGKRPEVKSTAVNLGGAKIKTPITNFQPRIGGHAN